MQNTSVCGRGRSPSPRPTTDAQAKALARIPAMFGGRPVIGTPAAPAVVQGQARVEATSPETQAHVEATSSDTYASLGATIFRRIPFLYGNNEV